MIKVPSLSYVKVIKALQKDGWIVIRQKGSHIRIQKRYKEEILKVTVPAHIPIKRSTLSHIIKQARITLEDFLKLL
jgi:predicted RNA binding protein YcfA (HicA-like mRNA interferase family)